MADVTADDISQATQGAVAALQPTLNDIAMSVHNIQGEIMRLGDVQNRVMSLEQTLSHVQSAFQHLETLSQRSREDATAQPANSLRVLEQRLDTIEALARDTSQYLQGLHAYVARLTALYEQAQPDEPKDKG